MLKMNEEQTDAVMFDRTLLAECLDTSIGYSLDTGGHEDRARRIAELQESLRKRAA